MLVSQTSPLGVELFSYANAFFCYNKFAYMLATLVKTTTIFSLKLATLLCDVDAYNFRQRNFLQLEDWK